MSSGSSWAPSAFTCSDILSSFFRTYLLRQRYDTVGLRRHKSGLRQTRGLGLIILTIDGIEVVRRESAFSQGSPSTPGEETSPMTPSRFLSLLVLLCGTGVPGHAAEPFRFPEKKHGKGELKYVNKLPVLVLSGTPEEMGEAA